MIPGEPIKKDAPFKQLASTQIDNADEKEFHKHEQSIYDKETQAVGFNVTDYYIFHREHY